MGQLSQDFYKQHQAAADP